MQGHQLVHRAHRLLKRYPRITLIGSVMATRAGIDDPQNRAGAATHSDPEDVALIESARHSRGGERETQRIAEATEDLSIPLPELRRLLEEEVAGSSDEVARLRALG